MSDMPPESTDLSLDAVLTKKDKSGKETDSSKKYNMSVGNIDPDDDEKDEIEVVKGQKSSSYAAKKSVAQRMMDIALLTSNANQLRYVLAFGSGAYFGISIALIVISLSLQLAVGIFMIFKSKPKDDEEKDRNNSIVVSLVLIITIVNVLITAFSIDGSTSAPAATPPNSSDSRLGGRIKLDFLNITESTTVKD